jgi:hypothetical protein
MLGWLNKRLWTSDSRCMLIDNPSGAVAYQDWARLEHFHRWRRGRIFRRHLQFTLLWLWSLCRFRAATAYTHGDNDLVMTKVTVISRARFRRSSYIRHQGSVLPLDNCNRISLALLLSEFLFLLFQVH